jgi:hypothetical protein
MACLRRTPKHDDLERPGQTLAVRDVTVTGRDGKGRGQTPAVRDVTVTGRDCKGRGQTLAVRDVTEEGWVMDASGYLASERSTCVQRALARWVPSASRKSAEQKTVRFVR